MIFYNRIVLGPLSILTWANMNFTLCASSSKINIADPFYPIVGKYYYSFIEIPVSIFVYIYCMGVFLIAKTFIRFRNKSKSQ